jgi:hypothetical protein
MKFKFQYPTDKLRSFIPYCFLGLDCNVSVVEAVVRHCPLFPQFEFINRVLQFADSSCTARVLHIYNVMPWSVFEQAVAETCVRIIENNIFDGHETFVLSESDGVATLMACAANALSRKVYRPRPASVKNFLYTRKKALKDYPHLRADRAIAIVNDHGLRTNVTELKEVVGKVVFCTQGQEGFCTVQEE